MLKAGTFRITLIVIACAVSMSAHAVGETPRKVNVAAGELGSALRELASQSGAEFLYSPDQVKGLRTSGVRGEYTKEDAVAKLLEGTNLELTVRESGAMYIGSPLARADGEQAHDDPIRVAQAGTAGAASAAIERNQPLTEVIVTAQKREEKLFDVPISIVALSADELERRHVVALDDLSAIVPGLFVLSSSGSGQRFIMMRGISNALGNLSSSLIGMYLDEASVTSGLQAQLDLRTYDLERVEVLRGPQGTLYGEGSAGGTIRFITKNPQLNRFSMSADVAGMFTQDGEPGQRVQSVVNVPLIDNELGIRVAGTYEHGGGWIDQPAAGKSDFNGKNLMDVRVKGLWKPMPELAVNTTIVVHRNDEPLSNREDANGDFVQLFNLTTTPAVQDDYDLYNVTGSYDFASVRLLNSASYLEADKEMRNVGNPVQITPPGTPQFHVYNPLRTLVGEIFTDELRLSSTGEGAWQWTIGAFYRDFQFQDFSAGSIVGLPGAPGAPLPNPAVPRLTDITSKSGAVFGDTSYKLTQRFTLGAGLRYFEDDQDYLTRRGTVEVLQTGSFHTTNPRVYAQYKWTDQVNTYVSAAKGFRSGGFNATASLPTYDPESVWSYELGMKIASAGGQVTADVAVFYSDYRDYQINGINLERPELGNIISNAGDARIRGIEWGFAWMPTEQWRLSLSGDYLDTEFVEINARSTAYLVGDPVDQFPKYGATFLGQRDFKWAGRDGSVRLEYNRRGRATYRNRSIGPWYYSESNLIDMLNFGANLQWNDNVSLGLFAQNLLNDRGYIDPLSIEAANRSRPRTYGIELGVTF